MLACAPALARSSGVVLSYGPHLTCILAALWCAARFLRRDASPGWAWAAGLCAGVGFNLRPEALGVMITFGMVATWRGWKRPEGERRGRLALGLVLGGP
jgi:4-amino-4-deoxy-L-arabinose transferase-like glycosyltransferase